MNNEGAELFQQLLEQHEPREPELAHAPVWQQPQPQPHVIHVVQSTPPITALGVIVALLSMVGAFTLTTLAMG